MENEKIARPWQSPNMPDQVAELIENDQVLQNMNIRGLASADSEEVRAAIGNLRQILRRQYAAGKRAGVQQTIMIGAAGILFGAGIAAILISLLG